MQSSSVVVDKKPSVVVFLYVQKGTAYSVADKQILLPNLELPRDCPHSLVSNSAASAVQLVFSALWSSILFFFSYGQVFGNLLTEVRHGCELLWFSL